MRTVKPKQPREYQDEIRRARRWQCGGDGSWTVAALEDLPFEFMLNALRLNEGFSNDCYQERTGLPLQVGGGEAAGGPRSAVCWIEWPDGWQPSELGRRFLNDLQASFLA